MGDGGREARVDGDYAAGSHRWCKRMGNMEVQCFVLPAGFLGLRNEHGVAVLPLHLDGIAVVLGRSYPV